MPVNIADLFVNLDAQTEGLRRAQSDLNAFRQQVKFTTAETAKFLSASELKNARTGADNIRKLNSEVRRVRASIDPAARAAEKFAKAQAVLNRAVRNGIITQSQARNALTVLRTRLFSGGAAAQGFKAAMTDLSKSVQIALGPLSGIAARITALSGLISGTTAKIGILVSGTIAFGAAVLKSTQAVRQFEAALAGVAKTTDLTDGEIQQLGRDFLRLSQDLITPAPNLLQLAEAAGQLGIQGRENITKFATVVAQLGVTSDLIGQEAAQSLARLINVTTTGIGDIDKLGSVITVLGNNSAATEKQIQRIAQEVGQATSQFGISAFEAEAFGAVLASIGARAELSGSVLGRAFRAIDASIRESGETFKLLQQLTGQTAEELEVNFRDRPGQVFRAFIEGLGRVDTEAVSLTQVLEAFNLKGEEINKILPSLAVNAELLSRSFGLVDEALQGPNATAEEFEKRANTLDQQILSLQNNLQLISITLGSDLLPVTRATVDAFVEATSDTRNLTTAVEAAGVAFAVLAGAGAIQGTLFVLRKLSPAIAAATTGVGALTIATRGLAAAFRFLFGPVGLAILGAEALFFYATAVDETEQANKRASDAIEQGNQALRDSVLLSADLANQRRLEAIATNEAAIVELELAKARVLAQVELARAARIGAERASPGNTELIEGFRRTEELLSFELANIAVIIDKLDAQRERLFEPIEAPESRLPSRFVPELPDDTTEKTRRAIEANKAAQESLAAIRREIIAIEQGATALDEFNRQKKVEAEVRRLVNSLRREEGETVAAFEQRKIDFENEARQAVDERSKALVVLNDELEKEKNQVKELEKVGQRFGNVFASAFEDAIVEGKALNEIINALGRDILRIIVRLAVTEPLQRGITGIAGAVSQAFASGGGAGLGPQYTGTGTQGLLAAGSFQSGGEFTVPGAGGTDSTAVFLRATPGERVSVSRPGQSTGSNVVVNVINNTDSQARVQRRTTNFSEEIDVIIDRAVARSLNRRGRTSDAIENQFNVNRRVAGR